jgi:hypothetical protein
VRVVSTGALILYMVEMLSTNLLQSARNADVVSKIVDVSKGETLKLLTTKLLKIMEKCELLVKKTESSEVAKKVMT